MAHRLNCMTIHLVLATFNYLQGGLSIGCFQCQSVNGSDPKCDDPFFNNFVENSVYQPDCKSGMKGRDGLYPASDCVKIKGNYVNSGESIVIRTCTVDSGSLTMDTELNRIEHMCGMFYFTNSNSSVDATSESDTKVRGCVEVCGNSDGCNKSSESFSKNKFIVLSLSVLVIVFLNFNNT